MNKLLSFLVLMILVSSCSKKAVPAIEKVEISSIIKNVKIVEGPATGPGPCEPSICINPADPSQILAASILDRIHLSEDGGKTWNTSKLTSSVGVYGDPVVRVSNQGTYYFSHLTNPSGRPYASEDFLDRIQVQKSTDNGLTWNDGSAPDNDRKKDQDKQWLYIDPVKNDVLMSWTEFDKYGDKEKENCSRILFSKSTDECESWSAPVTISDIEGDCVDDDFTTEGAVPAMDKDGNIYVTWAHGKSIYMDKSKDGGATWLEKDKVVIDLFGGWALDIPGISRCNGMPVLGIDRSDSKYSGNLYVNWSDQMNGADDTDIWLTKSSDGGNTWSDRIRVNDDAAGKHQFFTWMDVDPITGNIYVVFYDRRAYDDNQTDVYLAYSTDGGDSFTNVKISETPFTPTLGVFFGDYNDISAYDGMVRPIWTRLSDGKLSVWTALVNMK